MTSQTWTAAATPENAGALRRAAVAFASANCVVDPPINDFRLAVAEALNNAVMHAFGDGPPGLMSVSVSVDRGGCFVLARVSDDGHGMRPRSDSPGLGLGLPLISLLADATDFNQSSSVGTEVSMTFDLEAASRLN